MTEERNVHVGPTTGSVIRRLLRAHPDYVAFSWADGQSTYRDVEAMIARFQRALTDAGLTRGQGVAALGGNRVEVWAAGIAVQSLGLYITWLHPMGGLPDQLFQIDDSQVSAVLLDETHFAERSAALAGEAQTRGLTILTIGPSEFAPDLISAAAAYDVSEMRIDGAQPHDRSIINYTGGTTGQPKGAERRHPNALSGATHILADFEIPHRAQYLMVAPLSHVAGSKVLPVLARGGTVHLLTGFDPATVLEVIERERITMALFVPTMIYALLDHPDLATRDLSSLELVLYGASPMSVTRLTEGIAKLGPVFSQLYGQTECYPISVLSREDHDPDRADLLLSCGKPVIGVEVSIRDEANEEVPRGEPGELCVRSGSVMDGYWNRPDLTADAMAGDWLHTSDIARMDEQGYLYIVDRKKDMIISGGFNVYPREVEDALTAHPAVAMAAVYGLPDEKWGEQVTATVVLKPSTTVTADDLMAHVKAVKGAVQSPKHIDFADALPQTAVGKIDKRAIRARYLAQQSSGAS